MRLIHAACFALALCAAPVHAQAENPLLAPSAGSTAAAPMLPLPAMLQPRGAEAAVAPASGLDAALRPRLRNHILWGAAIGAVAGALLGSYAGAETCLGDIDEDCGEGAPLRGALIFGAVGAGVGALVYTIRT